MPSNFCLLTLDFALVGVITNKIFHLLNSLVKRPTRAGVPAGIRKSGERLRLTHRIAGCKGVWHTPSVGQGRLRCQRSLPSDDGPRQGATRKSSAAGGDCSKAPGAAEGGRRPKKGLRPDGFQHWFHPLVFTNEDFRKAALEYSSN